LLGSEYGGGEDAGVALAALAGGLGLEGLARNRSSGTAAIMTAALKKRDE
jgi:hypothetical protein